MSSRVNLWMLQFNYIRSLLRLLLNTENLWTRIRQNFLMKHQKNFLNYDSMTYRVNLVAVVPLGVCIRLICQWKVLKHIPLNQWPGCWLSFSRGLLFGFSHSRWDNLANPVPSGGTMPHVICTCPCHRNCTFLPCANNCRNLPICNKRENG